MPGHQARPAGTQTGQPSGVRRRTLLRLAAVGVGRVACAGLLAACGGATTATPEAGAGAGRAAPTPAVNTGTTMRGTVAAGPPTSAPSTASGTVSFSVWGDPAEKAAYERLVASSNQRQSRVTATLIHTPGQSDYLKRLAADFAGGTPADIVLLNYRRFGAYAARGALAPVGPYLAQSTTLAPGDFYPEVIAAFTRDGQLVGIPQNVSSLVIYYNQRLFDQAGIPYPTDGWTWDDFLQAARALTAGTARYGVGIEPSLVRLAPFIW